jgi:hypothetical protein
MQVTYRRISNALDSRHRVKLRRIIFWIRLLLRQSEQLGIKLVRRRSNSFVMKCAHQAGWRVEYKPALAIDVFVDGNSNRNIEPGLNDPAIRCDRRGRIIRSWSPLATNVGWRMAASRSI